MYAHIDMLLALADCSGFDPLSERTRDARYITEYSSEKQLWRCDNGTTLSATCTISVAVREIGFVIILGKVKKVTLSLGLINEGPRHKDIWKSGNIAQPQH
jgi:hypothetical protein